MTHYVLLALLLATTASAQPSTPLSLTNRPDGIAEATWKDIWTRADKLGRMAAKTVRGANADCITATVLDILAWAEVSVSKVARKDPSEGLAESVTKGKGSKVQQAVRRNRDDRCRGPGGGGGYGAATATDLEALLRFTSDNNEWQTSDPDSWRRTVDALRAAFAAGLGREAAGAAAPASLVPLINPCVVDPTLKACPQPGA